MRRLLLSPILAIAALLMMMLGVSTVQASTCGTSAIEIDVTNTNDSGPGSLRQAIINADTPNPPSADICFTGAGIGQVTLLTPLPTIDQSMNIIGPTPSSVIIDGGGGNGPIIHDGGITGPVINVSNLTLQNANSGGNSCGGAVANSLGFTLNLSNVTVRNNSSSTDGGGICNLGTMEIKDSLVGGANPALDGNKALGSNGGGIFNAGTLTLTNVTVTNCTASSGLGGGIFNRFNSTLNMTNSTVSLNKADAHGGGLYCDGISTTTLDNSQVLNNTADNDGNLSGDGGGIYAFGFDGGANITLKNGTIVNGNQSQNGGGIFVGPIAVALIDNSVISNNQAMVNVSATQQGGGGIFNLGVLAIENQSTIDSNHADLANGGGIYHSQRGLQANNALLDSISANAFAIDINNPPASLTIEQTTISNNTAGVDGGGIYRDNDMLLTNVTISNNQANLVPVTNGEGGGIYNNGAVQCPNGTLLATLINVTIAENSAQSGGGISVTDPCFPVNIKNSIVANNTTGGDCSIINGGVLTSQGFNLSSDNTCTSFAAATGDFPDQVPNIGPLADNGGTLPVHPKTHALLLNSVAVDGVPPANCMDFGNPNAGPPILPASLTVDERGFPRPGAGFGPNCDIGAFELQAVNPPTPPPPPTPPVTLQFAEGGSIVCGRLSLVGDTNLSPWLSFFWTIPPALGLALRRKLKK